MTNNSWNNNVLAAGVTFNGGVTNIGTDAAANAINIGTGGAAKIITVGNATGATSVVVNCGTGALDLGANAIARTTTLGNTTGASVLNLRYGTGDMTLASATGTVMSGLDTGEITYPLQPAFLVTTPGSGNVTGDGSSYRIAFNAEIFDQNSDYNTGTYTFVAPVTGRYYLTIIISCQGFTAAHTVGEIVLTTSNRIYILHTGAPSKMYDNNTNLAFTLNSLADMDAADSAYGHISIYNGTKVVVVNATVFTYFSGYLAC